jgi:hypothetical protein
LSRTADDAAARVGDHDAVPAAISALIVLSALLAFLGLLGHRG